MLHKTMPGQVTGYRFAMVLCLVAATLSATNASAIEVEELIDYARSHAETAGYRLSGDSEQVISEAVRLNIDEINAGTEQLETTRAAIRRFIDLMATNALDAPRDDGGQATFDSATVDLALFELCPLWPLCS